MLANGTVNQLIGAIARSESADIQQQHTAELMTLVEKSGSPLIEENMQVTFFYAGNLNALENYQ